MQTYTNPQFPGKTFRRLEVGEVISKGALAQEKDRDFHSQTYKPWKTMAYDCQVEESDDCFYYVELPGCRPLEEGEQFAASETILTTDQRLDIILAKLERIDVVLAGLNKEEQ